VKIVSIRDEEFIVVLVALSMSRVRLYLKYTRAKTLN